MTDKPLEPASRTDELLAPASWASDLLGQMAVGAVGEGLLEPADWQMLPAYDPRERRSRRRVVLVE